MIDKLFIILPFIMFLFTIITYFTVRLPYIPISIGLIGTLITLIYSIIFFRDKRRFRKLDKNIKILFWINFILSTMVVNIIIIYIGYYIPSPKEFILNAPVPAKYQWIELKSINKNTPTTSITF